MTGQASRRQTLIVRLIGSVAVAALFALELLTSGLTPNAYALVALMVLGLLRWTGDPGRTTFGYWVQRYLEWATLLFVVIPLIGLAVPTVNGLPLFAHVEMSARAAGSSATVSSDVAPRGHRFVMVEATLVPKMLAPLDDFYRWDFHLRTGGVELEPVDATYDVVRPCFNAPRRRNAALRCHLVFAVPHGVTSGRLVYDEYPYGATSEEFLFGNAQAPVRRVEVEVVSFHQVSRIARPYGRSARDGQQFLYVDLRLESLLESRPYELDSFLLQGEGWEDYDSAHLADVRDPCSGVVVRGSATCTALFEIPRDAGEVRLTTWRYDFEDDYGVDIAGAADLSLGG